MLAPSSLYIFIPSPIIPESVQSRRDALEFLILILCYLVFLESILKMRLIFFKIK